MSSVIELWVLAKDLKVMCKNSTSVIKQESTEELDFVLKP